MSATNSMSFLIICIKNNAYIRDWLLIIHYLSANAEVVLQILFAARDAVAISFKTNIKNGSVPI